MWFENQFPYFLWMVLTGLGIMFLYDFLRIRRKLITAPDFLVNLEDLLFSVFSAILVFYITYLKNNGEIRWQTAVGLLIGASLYRVTVGDKWVKIGFVILEKTVQFTVRIIKLIIFPVVVILKVISRPLRVVIWYSGKSLNSLKIRGKIARKNMRNILRKK